MTRKTFGPLMLLLALSLGLMTAGCSKHKPQTAVEGTAAEGVAGEAAVATGAPAEVAKNPASPTINPPAENAAKPDFVTLPSGLRYRVLTPGHGHTPKADDYATVNYIGYHMDGRELDSSYKLGKPVTVPVAGLIPGWAEALLLMKEGAKWELQIPAKLAYGDEGVPGFIQPGEDLRFEVELVKVRTAKEVAGMRLKKFKEQEAYRLKNEQFLSENAKESGVITTPSGLQYKIIRMGNGPKPKLGDTVEVNYRGTLIDGAEFDSSYARRESATFPVSKVIKGWTEALIMMKEGSKWKLFVPAGLAYGADGAGNKIPPDSTLIFDVELIKIK